MNKKKISLFWAIAQFSHTNILLIKYKEPRITIEYFFMNPYNHYTCFSKELFIYILFSVYCFIYLFLFIDYTNAKK